MGRGGVGKGKRARAFNSRTCCVRSSIMGAVEPAASWQMLRDGAGEVSVGG